MSLSRRSSGATDDSARAVQRPDRGRAQSFARTKTGADRPNFVTYLQQAFAIDLREAGFAQKGSN
jgi:hypothetical protein